MTVHQGKNIFFRRQKLPEFDTAIKIVTLFLGFPNPKLSIFHKLKINFCNTLYTALLLPSLVLKLLCTSGRSVAKYYVHLLSPFLRFVVRFWNENLHNFSFYDVAWQSIPDILLLRFEESFLPVHSSFFVVVKVWKNLS